MPFRHHHPQRIAAAKAGFSERTARRMEAGRHSSPRRNIDLPLRQQTPDPFAGLWDAESKQNSVGLVKSYTDTFEKGLPRNRLKGLDLQGKAAGSSV